MIDLNKKLKSDRPPSKSWGLGKHEGQPSVKAEVV
jgi:hypothetical protein